MKRLVERTKAHTARLWDNVERLRSLGTASGVVLIYHRVGRPLTDPWNMSVSPENFADHMEILRRFAVPRTFGDFADRLEAQVPEPSIVVTFDDGYADNLLALPILEAHDVPATVFVVSGAVGNPRAFWWDRLTQIFLEIPKLPQRLLLNAGGTTLHYDLGDAATYDAGDLIRSTRWRADIDPPADARQRTYLEVWQHLVGLAPDEISVSMEALISWAGLSETVLTDSEARPVTRSELLQLAVSPLIEIGGHTRTHADLARLSRIHAADEIGGGRRDLIELTGRNVRSFAYPYGRLGPHTIADIRGAGFSCAGNSRCGLATPRNDRLALPRVHATDLSAEHFEALLWRFLAPKRKHGARK